MNFWYGGIKVDNVFTWSDKTPFKTTFWAPGEPNGLPGEDCIHMMDIHIGKWNDLSCNYVMRYVCKLGEGKWRISISFNGLSNSLSYTVQWIRNVSVRTFLSSSWDENEKHFLNSLINTTFSAPGEPNGPLEEDCMHMSDVNIGLWNDIRWI